MSQESQKDYQSSDVDYDNIATSQYQPLALVTGSVSQSDEHEWWNHRRCAGMPPWIFYPTITSKITENNDPYALARSICAGCSVRTECLEYAKATGETDGFWGGVDMSQQRKSAKKRLRGNQEGNKQ